MYCLYVCLKYLCMINALKIINCRFKHIILLNNADITK